MIPYFEVPPLDIGPIAVQSFGVLAAAGVRAPVEDPHLHFDVNLVGTLNLLEAARGHRLGNFGFASTSSTHGRISLPSRRTITHSCFSSIVILNIDILGVAANRNGTFMAKAAAAFFAAPLHLSLQLSCGKRRMAVSCRQLGRVAKASDPRKCPQDV